jgi:hypothetical protein
MGSGTMICIPSFIKIGSGITKLLRGIHIQTHKEKGGLLSLFLLFQNKESRLINDTPKPIKYMVRNL